LSSTPRNTRRQPDLAAYDLYLQGKHAWSRWTEDDLRLSVGLFERAIELDPAFALAHAGLGMAWGVLALGYWSYRPLETYPLARRELSRALELDPGISEAHSMLALVEAWFDLDWVGTGNRHRHALQLNPNAASAHDQYGVWLTALGRHVEAAHQYEEACRLDPLSLLFLANAGLGAYRARRYDEALRWFDRTIRTHATLPMGHGLRALVDVRLRDYTRALESSERAVQLSSGESSWRALRAFVCAACGEHQAARKSIEDLETRRAEENIWLVPLAMAYAALGEVDTAFERLEEAIRERSGWVAWLGVEPGLDPLRQDPRFQVLLSTLGLAEPA
jgi:serine/threonine-protein kinase